MLPINILFLYLELYPTNVRNIGVGIGSMSGRIGGILAPQISKLGIYYSWLPNTIVGILGIVAGLIR